MYCVASIGETDTFWRYRTFSQAQLDQMRDFILGLQDNGYLVRVYKQIAIKEL